MIDSMIPSIAARLPLNMSFNIDTAYSRISLTKIKADTLAANLYQGLGKFELPKFCGQILTKGYVSKLSSTVANQFYTPEDFSCESQPILVKVNYSQLKLSMRFSSN